MLPGVTGAIDWSVFIYFLVFLFISLCSRLSEATINVWYCASHLDIMYSAEQQMHHNAVKAIVVILLI
jgi:hypothetical protein